MTTPHFNHTLVEILPGSVNNGVVVPVQLYDPASTLLKDGGPVRGMECEFRLRPPETSWQVGDFGS